jgi:heavy metal efflux system protein
MCRKNYSLLMIVAACFFVFHGASAQQLGMTADDVVELAFKNNLGLKINELEMQQSKALIKTAFSTEKTNLYYGLDENNIAANDYPLYVAGIEQTLSFPTLYFARRQENKIAFNVSSHLYEVRKRQLEKNVRKSFYHLLFLLNRQSELRFLDSIYDNFSAMALKSLDLGETGYLEYLNAQAKQMQIHNSIGQMTRDIQTEYENLEMLVQADDTIFIRYEKLSPLSIDEALVTANPEHRYLESLVIQSSAKLRTELNNLLPDLTLTYFTGTNKHEDAEIYNGWEVGISLPLFFAGHAGNIKAASIGRNIAEMSYMEHERQIGSYVERLRNEVQKYRISLDNYYQTGNRISAGIITGSGKSYYAGEIGYFEYIQNLENAAQIEMDYLSNLDQYNQAVLDLNYVLLQAE